MEHLYRELYSFNEVKQQHHEMLEVLYENLHC